MPKGSSKGGSGSRSKGRKAGTLFAQAQKLGVDATTFNEVISTLPSDAIKSIESNGAKIVINNQLPTGAAGAYNWETKEIYLSSANALESASGKKTFIHELGHAYDHSLAKSRSVGGKSSEKEFQNAVKADLAKINRTIKKGTTEDRGVIRIGGGFGVKLTPEASKAKAFLKENTHYVRRSSKHNGYVRSRSKEAFAETVARIAGFGNQDWLKYMKKTSQFVENL